MLEILRFQAQFLCVKLASQCYLNVPDFRIVSSSVRSYLFILLKTYEKRPLKRDLSVHQESLFAFFVDASNIAAELQENIAVLAFFINGVGTS